MGIQAACGTEGTKDGLILAFRYAFETQTGE